MTARPWLHARLTGLGVELTDAALVTLVQIAEGLPRRKLDGEALARMQAEREAGIAPPEVDPEARALGAVVAAVIAEIGRADRMHGRSFPGGWGPSGRLEDHEAMFRAKDRCDAPASEGGGSFRHVLEEEVAEVFAEAGGSREQSRELIEVAAVACRGVLVSMGSEVRRG